MPSKIYVSPETPVMWTDAANSPDKALDLGGLTAGSIACGSYLDLGASARADVYEVEVIIDGFTDAPIVGDTIDIFFIQSNDTTNWDGPPTTAPTASVQGTVSLDQMRNALYAGSISVPTTTAANNLQSRFVVRLTGRYIAPVIYNRTADILQSSSDFHRVILTPLPYESQ